MVLLTISGWKPVHWVCLSDSTWHRWYCGCSQWCWDKGSFEKSFRPFSTLGLSKHVQQHLWQLNFDSTRQIVSIKLIYFRLWKNVFYAWLHLFWVTPNQKEWFVYRYISRYLFRIFFRKGFLSSLVRHIRSLTNFVKDKTDAIGQFMHKLTSDVK